jgi:hypothetical protein
VVYTGNAHKLNMRCCNVCRLTLFRTSRFCDLKIFLWDMSYLQTFEVNNVETIPCKNRLSELIALYFEGRTDRGYNRVDEVVQNITLRDYYMEFRILVI